jgi:hypothetical protein
MRQDDGLVTNWKNLDEADRILINVLSSNLRKALRKTMKTSSHDSRCPDSTTAPLQYESRASLQRQTGESIGWVLLVMNNDTDGLTNAASSYMFILGDKCKSCITNEHKIRERSSWSVWGIWRRDAIFPVQHVWSENRPEIILTYYPVSALTGAWELTPRTDGTYLKTQNNTLGKIWDFRGGGYEECRLLGCGAV